MVCKNIIIKQSRVGKIKVNSYCKHAPLGVRPLTASASLYDKYNIIQLLLSGFGQDMRGGNDNNNEGFTQKALKLKILIT